MKHELTHINIEQKPVRLDEDLSKNCEEADRQERIARHGLDLLVALHKLLEIVEKPRSSAAINRAINDSYEAITAATGQRPKF